MLASFVSNNQDDWDELLDPLCFAYNTSVHATTGFTPFELTFGRKPRLPIDLFYHALDGPDTVAVCDEFSNGLHPLQRDLKISSLLYAHELRETLQKTISIVNETSENKHRISKIQYDRKVYKYMFEINDLVAVLDSTTKKGVKKSLSDKKKGPFVIVGRFNNHNYLIANPLSKQRRTQKIHVNRLVMWHGCLEDKRHQPQDVFELNKEALERVQKKAIVESASSSSLPSLNMSIKNNNQDEVKTPIFEEGNLTISASSTRLNQDEMDKEIQNSNWKSSNNKSIIGSIHDNKNLNDKSGENNNEVYIKTRNKIYLVPNNDAPKAKRKYQKKAANIQN
jgi:hypothetical protein